MLIAVRCEGSCFWPREEIPRHSGAGKERPAPERLRMTGLKAGAGKEHPAPERLRMTG